MRRREGNEGREGAKDRWIKGILREGNWESEKKIAQEEDFKVLRSLLNTVLMCSAYS